MANWRDYLHLHFLVFLWGFTAILGKLVSIPAVEMVFFRTLLATVGMAVVIAASKNSFRVTAVQLAQTFFTGFIIAAHWITFFASARLSNPSTSLVGFATCSLWAAVIEPFARRRSISALEIGLGLLVMAGLYIIFSFNFSYPLGLLLGVLSGLTAAIFGVINARLVERVSPLTITFYEMTGACVAVALFFPAYQTWFTNEPLQLSPSATDWIYIAILAIVCSVYAYTAMVSLSRRLSVFFIQLTLNLEPVYGILLALMVFGPQEAMTWNFYLGAAVMLGAVALYPYLKSRRLR